MASSFRTMASAEREFWIILAVVLSCLSIHCSAFQILRYPGVTTANLKKFLSALRDVHPQVLTRLDIDGKLSIR